MLWESKNRQEQFFRAIIRGRKSKAVQRRIQNDRTAGPRWILALLWIAFSVVGGYVLFFSPMLLVRGVLIEGAAFIPSDEYRVVVDGLMAGTHIGILKRQNFFFAPTGEMERVLLSQYPVIQKISIQRSFPNHLVVRIVETQTILQWCSGGPCYGIHGGQAVPITPSSEDSRYDPIRLSVIDESAPPVAANMPITVDVYLQTFLALYQNFGKFIPGSVDRVAKTASRHSDELTLSVSEGWKFIVSVNRPAEESLGVLKVFLDEYAKTNKDRSRLLSVDLRVEGKIFYSEQNTLSPEETSFQKGDDDQLVRKNSQREKGKKN